MPRLTRRVPANGDVLAPELRAELEDEPKWMYPWDLAPGVVAPVIDPDLPRIHLTRLAMMEAAVRGALGASEDRSVLDLACNEGWFAHRMLELGATRVLGVDIREVNVRRAELVREALGAGPELEFRQGDLFELDEEIAEFDVVLLLGLIYHVEDPVGAVRRARRHTKRLCVIESQLTRQRDPIEWGGVAEGARFLQEGSFAAHLEPDSAENPLASAEGILSLIPNRAAVEQMAKVAGFERVEMVDPPPLADEIYISGDRGLFLCWN